MDLTHAVKQGAFREDIYYRLHVAILHLPALRERPKDILPLVDRFIAQFSERLGFPIPQLSAEAQACLTAYSWPGNVRELENRIHHTLLVSRQLLLQPQDFGSVIAEAISAQLHHKEVTADDAFIAALRGLFAAYDSKVYDAVQRLLFNEAYHFCNKNQVHTAQLLGLSRNITRAELIRIGSLVANKRHAKSVDLQTH